MKKILAVGAFERDNFGDLLFLRVLRDFMQNKDVEITPASIIFSDMRNVNGEIVYPYDLMLRLYKWDVVWVVGGEVGGVDITGAILMDAVDIKGQHYGLLDQKDREVYDTLLGIPRGNNLSAYLPNIHSYSKNRNTMMIINSVGLSNSRIGTEMSKKEVATLSRSVVSVRENMSAKFCEENNIPHTLSPDVVSAISYFHPFKGERTQKPYIVVQVNHDLLSKTKLVNFTRNLNKISEYLNAEIVLLRAGVTFSHDDDTLYKNIISQFASLKPRHKIKQYEKRDPLLIAELIAGAKLCIATSLHCRVVSRSYDTPHISLSNAKVTNYAMTWMDDDYPYDVSIDFLMEAIIKIKEKIDDPVKNESLRKKALENIERLYSKAVAVNSDFNNMDSLDGLYTEYISGQKRILDNMFTDILSERDSSVARIQELEQQKSELSSQNILLEQQQLGLLNSWSWRFTKPLRFIRRLTNQLLHRG